MATSGVVVVSIGSLLRCCCCCCCTIFFSLLLFCDSRALELVVVDICCFIYTCVQIFILHKCLLLTAPAGDWAGRREYVWRRVVCVPEQELIECQFVCCFSFSLLPDFVCLSGSDSPPVAALTYCLLQTQYWTCIIGQASPGRACNHCFIYLPLPAPYLSSYPRFLNRQIFGQPWRLSLFVLCQARVICIYSRPCSGIKNLIKSSIEVMRDYLVLPTSSGGVNLILDSTLLLGLIWTAG